MTVNARNAPSSETRIDDRRLAAALRAGLEGDEHAYHSFLTEIATRLRRQVAARARGLAAEDVEDVVQDILISVHTSRRTWDSAKPLLPWLSAIARYRLADHLRRIARGGRLTEEMRQVSETFEPFAANTSSNDVIEEMTMKAALAELSPKEREAFALVRLGGHTMEEAAQASGSTVAAVKVAVHRAARRLQALVRGGSL